MAMNIGANDVANNMGPSVGSGALTMGWAIAIAALFEALGAIGIARMFHVAGAMGGQLFDSDDPMAQRRPLNDRRYALDHIETKLLRLVDTMQTAPGRAIAETRADWLMSFRTRLLAELG